MISSRPLSALVITVLLAGCVETTPGTKNTYGAKPERTQAGLRAFVDACVRRGVRRQEAIRAAGRHRVRTRNRYSKNTLGPVLEFTQTLSGKPNWNLNGFLYSCDIKFRGEQSGSGKGSGAGSLFGKGISPGEH